MTDEQREDLTSLVREWLTTPPEALSGDMLATMRRQSLRSDAVQGARALLKELEVEAGGSLW